MTPMVRVRVERRLRPIRFGLNPSDFAAANTASAVWRRTVAVELTTRDTVATETPALRATSLMVATLGSGLSSERRITSRNNNLVNVYIVLFFCYRFMTLFAFEIQANTP